MALTIESASAELAAVKADADQIKSARAALKRKFDREDGKLAAELAALLARKQEITDFLAWVAKGKP